MLAHGVYSVISPEGCAPILWDDPTKVPDAAAALKMTAKDLVDLHSCLRPAVRASLNLRYDSQVLSQPQPDCAPAFSAPANAFSLLPA
jgi:hypothetical protein